jgi:hypothetical protein
LTFQEATGKNVMLLPIGASDSIQYTLIFNMVQWFQIII